MRHLFWNDHRYFNETCYNAIFLPCGLIYHLLLTILLDGIGVGSACFQKLCDYSSRVFIMARYQAFADEITMLCKGFLCLVIHIEDYAFLIAKLLETGGTNSYTIQKNGQKKMIYQTAWKEDGVVAGLVEISMVIPEEMPHYIR